MALTAKYETSSNVIENAIFKILRIWGSKQEGWNAWVGVFKNISQEIPDEQFSVHADYVDGQNPFDALYSAVGKLSFVVGAKHDIVTALNSKVEPVVVTVAEVAVAETATSVAETATEQKKTRKKKI